MNLRWALLAGHDVPDARAALLGVPGPRGLRSLAGTAARACLLTIFAVTFTATLTVQAQSTLPVPDSGENEWKELGVSPPAFPKAETLIRFPTSWTTSEVYVDGATLAVGDDKVVRFVLVIKASGGAENISFEGMRCESGQRRVYAFGRRDGTWSPARVSEWRAVEDARINRHHFEFWRDVFCENKATETRAGILRNLQRGGRERQQSIPSD